MYGPKLKLHKAVAISFLANTVFSVDNKDTICQTMKGKQFWIGSWHCQINLNFHFVVAYLLYLQIKM